jgi:glycosyltransferase involved in cell wall biosynthesis
MSSRINDWPADGNRKRIWYLITALSIGGTERTLIDVANNIDHDRYEVTIWTLFEQNPLAPTVTEEVTLRSLGAEGTAPSGGNHYVERAENPLDYLRVPLRFLKAVQTNSPDIIQSFLFYDNLIARIAGVVSSKTTTITGVRSVPENRSRVKEALDRFTMPLSDWIVSNSKAGAEFVADHGASAEQIEVIYNGRDLDQFATASSAELEDSVDVPNDAQVVGTVGRLIERKGHRDLLAAWPAVQERCPKAHLLLIGDGPERESLERYATELGCRESVSFLGFRDDVPVLLDLMDVFVFPSHFEGLPGALIEAMAAGVPIVTTPVTGNAELIDNYRTGLHVAARQPEEIKWALIRLLEYRSLAASISEAAEAKAQREFALDYMVAGFERLYDTVLDTGVNP